MEERLEVNFFAALAAVVEESKEEVEDEIMEEANFTITRNIREDTQNILAKRYRFGDNSKLLAENNQYTASMTARTAE